MDGGGEADGEATTGAEGCSRAVNPGLSWMSRAIEGERLAGACLELAAAVDCVAAVRLREEVGCVALPRKDSGSGAVAIGVIGIIGRSLTGAGAFFDVSFVTAAGGAAEK